MQNLTNMSTTEKEVLLERIDTALEAVRPHLAVDGGNVKVVDVLDDMTVQVQWLGSCSACSMSEMTMKAGVEVAIRNRVPEVGDIVAV